MNQYLLYKYLHAVVKSKHFNVLKYSKPTKTDNIPKYLEKVFCIHLIGLFIIIHQPFPFLPTMRHLTKINQISCNTKTTKNS